MLFRGVISVLAHSAVTTVLTHSAVITVLFREVILVLTREVLIVFVYFLFIYCVYRSGVIVYSASQVKPFIFCVDSDCVLVIPSK